LGALRGPDLFELLEDGRDRSAKRNGVITQTNDIASGARDTEESGSALFLERGSDLFGYHLEFHFEIHQVFVE
jgi:hypothetical protein